MLKSRHPALPGLIALALFALWTVFWMVMESRIEGEIEDWVERQAAHGTEVTYSSLDISGYPFRLVATFDDPHIVSNDDPSALVWAGEQLRIITQAWDIYHIIIELVGAQHISWVDEPADGSRSSSAMTVDFTGSSLRGSLALAGGHIESIDTDFRDVSADFVGDGAFALVGDYPEHLDVASLEYHSRLRKEERGGARVTNRDVMVEARDIVGGDAPAASLSEGVERLLIAFSEELTGESRLHSGDIGASQPPAEAHRVDIHEASILWQPLSLRLNGALRRPEGEDFSGEITLYLKGHEELIREMAEDGDLPDAAAVVVGALFGILSMISETNEDGELIVPLDVKDGEVKFGFLPLFEVDDLR